MDHRGIQKLYTWKNQQKHLDVLAEINVYPIFPLMILFPGAFGIDRVS